MIKLNKMCEIFTIGYSSYHQEGVERFDSDLAAMSGVSTSESWHDRIARHPLEYSNSQNYAVKRFAEDLLMAGVCVVVDVRSSPYSSFSPEFDRERLKSSMAEYGITYLFMGDELGARPKDRGCYKDGAVDYDRIMNSPAFVRGLDRIETGIAKGFSIALMCAEKDPVDCHRNVLVARALSKRGLKVRHFVRLPAGGPAVIEENSVTEARMFAECDMEALSQGDLFVSDEERIERVYRTRFGAIAFKED